MLKLKSKINPEIVIFLALFTYYLMYAAFVKDLSFLYGDPTGDFFSTVSLYEDGDLDISNQLGFDLQQTFGQVALGLNNQWYNVHEPLLSFIGLPAYMLMDKFGLLFLNMILTALIAVVGYQISCRFTSRTAAACASLVVGSGLHLTTYSYSFSHDILGTLFLITGLLCFICNRMLCAGLILGLLWLARVPFAPLGFAYFTIFLIELIFLKDKFNLGHFIRFSCAYLAATLLYFLANYKMYGGLLTTGYNRWLCNWENGSDQMCLHSSKFNWNFFNGLIDNILDCQDGILFTGSIYCISIIIALYFCAKSHLKINFIIISQILCLLLIFSVYTSGTEGNPNRYHLPIVAFSIIYLSILIDQISLKICDFRVPK